MRSRTKVRPILVRLGRSRPRAPSSPPRAPLRVALRGAAALLVALSFSTSGCPDETDVILVADASEGAIRVTGTGDGATITVSALVTLELGSYAQEEQVVVIPRADILVDDAVVGTVNLDRPTSFDGHLSPGETKEVRVRGEAMGSSIDVARLCAASSAVISMLYGPSPTMTPDVLRTSAPVTCE